MPTKSVSAWGLPLASTVPTAQPEGMPSPAWTPLLPSATHSSLTPGSCLPLLQAPGFPRQWLLHSATGSSAGTDSACFAESRFPAPCLCLCLYRVGVPHAQCLGPAPLPLGDASQASALTSKLKKSTVCLLVPHRCPTKQLKLYLAKTDGISPQKSALHTNPRPNISPNSSCQMLRSKPQELS